MSATRRQTSKLKQLVFERNPELLPTVVHLARSLDDGEIVDTLLEGASYEKRRLVPGVAFAALPRKARHHAIMATLALIATGLGDRAEALRAQVVRLDLTSSYPDRHGKRHPSDPLTPVDLELLLGLPLQTLRATGIEIRHTDRLGAFEHLRALSIDTIDPEHLRGLAKLETLMTGVAGDFVPTLESCEELQLNTAGPIRIDPQPSLLTLTTWNRGRVHLRSAPQLYRAEMSQALELVADEALPRLRHLHIAGVIRSPEHLVALEDLRTRSQAGVADLPALRRLQLEGPATSLAELAGVEVELFRGPDQSLTTLDGYPRSTGAPHRKLPALRSLAGIDAIAGIQTLELRAVTSLDGIGALRETLRGLDLRDCREVRELGPLEGLDLRAILVAGTELRPGMFPESLRWAVVRKRNASIAALAMRERPTTAPR